MAVLLFPGAPEVLDSSRSRHGDFEFGPIAIFHHPRRIQQMMLLRFEFLNTVTTDPVELGELHRVSPKENDQVVLVCMFVDRGHVILASFSVAITSMFNPCFSKRVDLTISRKKKIETDNLFF